MKPWNLKQVSTEDKETFRRLLIDLISEGRKLTPIEVVKVEKFLEEPA